MTAACLGRFLHHCNQVQASQKDGTAVAPRSFAILKLGNFLSALTYRAWLRIEKGGVQVQDFAPGPHR